MSLIIHGLDTGAKEAAAKIAKLEAEIAKLTADNKALKKQLDDAKKKLAAKKVKE